MINQQTLRDMFEYVSTTGQLIHRYTVQGGKQAGQPAGSPHNQGYLQIGIRRKKYLIHRLVWLYHFGEWPGQLDHVNRIRSDNRIENLRECNYSQNHGNRHIDPRNTSGAKGVSYYESNDRYRAQLASRYVGQYRTLKEASDAYDKAAVSHFGEFSLTNKKIRGEP